MHGFRTNKTRRDRPLKGQIFTQIQFSRSNHSTSTRYQIWQSDPWFHLLLSPCLFGVRDVVTTDVHVVWEHCPLLLRNFLGAEVTVFLPRENFDGMPLTNSSYFQLSALARFFSHLTGTFALAHLPLWLRSCMAYCSYTAGRRRNCNRGPSSHESSFTCKSILNCRYCDWCMG